MTDDRGQITALLEAHAQGDPRAFDRLFVSVYGELQRLARGQRRRGGPPLSLDTVGLVHELYLKLTGGVVDTGRDREHFFAIAARAMRHLLVDHARAVGRRKRGGDAVRVTLSRADEAAVELDAERVLAVDEALGRLAELEPRLVRVVEFRYFVGFTEEETAKALGVSLRTVQRDWRAASRWLARELGASASLEADG